MDFYQFPTSLGLMALASEGDFITHLYLPSYPTPRLEIFVLQMEGRGGFSHSLCIRIQWWQTSSG